MEEVRHSRFKGAEWYSENLEDNNVLIGGAGGIGSWLTYFLYKIGLHVTVRDFDRVEEHNLGGQLLSGYDLGNYKVNALKNMLRLSENKEYLDRIRLNKTPIEAHTQINISNVFSAFDNMEARINLFNAWLEFSFNYTEENGFVAKPGHNPIFIDGRLEMEQLQIFAVRTHEQIVKYRTEHLFEDSEVEEAACTMKQTSHTAAIISAKMASIYTNHLANINTGIDSRIIPFYYEEFTPLFLNTIEI